MFDTWKTTFSFISFYNLILELNQETIFFSFIIEYQNSLLRHGGELIK